MQEKALHIPAGINYECTGCGICCGGWAVPLTEEDYRRISPVNWKEHESRFDTVSIYRKLKDHEKEGTPYTHAIKEADNGRCPFLFDNLCLIHKTFDSKTKPSICQLFPYSFNETPSGVYATVSFISMGVCHNSGKALTEQREYLEGKWKEFRSLFPDHHPNWSRLLLATGQPMTWDQYLEHERHLLAALAERQERFEDRLLKGSDYLFCQLPNQLAPRPVTNLAMKKLDKQLLVALHRQYYPVAALSRERANFGVARFIMQCLTNVPLIELPSDTYSFDQLHEFAWDDSDQAIEDLLYRFFFSRIYGKFYFGAGFGQLSLITGFHHLILVYALIKLRAKATAKARGATQVNYLDVIAAVRQAERRLGESSLNGYAAAVWELLMFSPQRMRRVLASL